MRSDVVPRAGRRASPGRSTDTRYPEAVSQLAARLGSGELRSHEDVITGPVGDFPEVFLRRFRGENTGKLILALGNGGCRNLAASVKQPDMPARKENL